MAQQPQQSLPYYPPKSEGGQAPGSFAYPKGLPKKPGGSIGGMQPAQRPVGQQTGQRVQQAQPPISPQPGQQMQQPLQPGQPGIPQPGQQVQQPPVIPPPSQPIPPPGKPQQQDGKKPKKPMKRLKFVIAGLVVLFAVVVAIVIVYQRVNFSDEDVLFDVTGPVGVQSGKEASIEIRYENKTASNSLNGAILALEVPSNFHYVSSELSPTNSESLEWNLGDIGPKTEQTFIVTGIFYGDEGVTSDIKATLSADAGGLSGDVLMEKSYTGAIVPPNFEIDLDVPQALNAGSAIEYDLEITNQEKDPYRRLAVRATYPDGFTFESADPAPASGNNYWEVDEMQPGEKFRVVVRGLIAGETDEQKNVSVEIGNRDEENTFYVQYEANDVTIIASPTITISQSASVNVASAGDSVKFVMTVTNVGSSALTNLELHATIESPVVNKQSLVIDSGGVLRDNTITWDNTVIKALKVLEPNQSFEVGYAVATYPTLTARGNNFTIISTPNIQLGQQDISGEVATVKIRSLLGIKAVPSPFDSLGNPVGPGPTTPKVGQETTYRLMWTLDNHYNEILDARVSCTIPIGSTFLDSYDVSEGTSLAFDSVAKTVIWTIGKIQPKTLVGSGAVVAGYFDVKISPSITDVEQQIILARGCRFAGTDGFTKEEKTPVIEDLLSEEVRP